MGNKYKHLTRILSTLILAVVLFQLLSKVIWQHAHVFSDGTVVTHTHPYNRAADSEPFKKHYHSNFEFLFLQYLESLVPILFIAVLSATIASSLKLQNNPFFYLVSFLRITASGRSPPAL